LPNTAARMTNGITHWKLRISCHTLALPVMPAVETVEKVTYQKLLLKSGIETLKNAWFLVFCTIFWQYFSVFFCLLWEIFFDHFQN
jgi:hypothetical protein